MKCEKCGNTIKNNECEYCGEKLKKYINVVSDEELKIRNKKCNNISILIIGFSIAAFLFYIGLGIRLTKDYSVKEKIVFGENEIPSFYNITGNKKISTYHIAKTLEVMKYETSDLKEEELEAYILALYNINFYDVSDNDESMILIKKAKEANKLIKVEMSSSDGTFVLKYELLDGKLENYGIEINKEIGNSEIGYIEIPEHYVLETNQKYSVKYYNPENLSENIVIQRIFNRSFDDIFKDNFTNTTKKKNVVLRGVSGVRLTDDYENVFSKIFILEKNENDIYLIKLHSNDENSSLFSSIYTYSFNK